MMSLKKQYADPGNNAKQRMVRGSSEEKEPIYGIGLCCTRVLCSGRVEYHGPCQVGVMTSSKEQRVRSQPTGTFFLRNAEQLLLKKLVG